MESERVTASYVWFILINPVRINLFYYIQSNEIL